MCVVKRFRFCCVNASTFACWNEWFRYVKLLLLLAHFKMPLKCMQWLYEYKYECALPRFLKMHRNISLNKCDSKTFQIVAVIVHSSRLLSDSIVLSPLILMCMDRVCVGILYLFMPVNHVICIVCSINFMQVV